MKYFLCILVYCFLAACNTQDTDSDLAKKDDQVKESVDGQTRDFPEEVDLHKLQATAFVPTLENIMPENKNIIYAPTLLYAWDTIRNSLKFPARDISTTSEEIWFLNQSTTFQNSLKPGDCEINTTIAGDKITARAFFNIDLPFISPFKKTEKAFYFDSIRVVSFGMENYDKDIYRKCEILYYNSDNEFVLKLIPKESDHEMILAKGIENCSKLTDAIVKTKALINAGKSIKSSQSSYRKYEITGLDEIMIPELKFNIGNRFEEMEGKYFTCNQKAYYFESVYQRNAFILDEEGAVVESKTIMTAAPAAIGEPPPVKIQPKKLIFDKPFYIIVKRTDSENPYFVMKVVNSELMTKK